MCCGNITQQQSTTITISLINMSYAIKPLNLQGGQW